MFAIRKEMGESTKIYLSLNCGITIQLAWKPGLI